MANIAFGSRKSQLFRLSILKTLEPKAILG